MKTTIDDVIKKIKRNRISSTQIADTLDKTGTVKSVFSLNKGHHKVGRVLWVYAYNESNWDVHEQIRDINEGDILFVEAFACKDRAIFGSLVSKFCLLYRQAEAIVVLGNIRDVPHLIKENSPIWSTGANPIGCFNTKNKKPFDPKILKSRKKLYANTIAVCDDTGVVIIPNHLNLDEFSKKLDLIEEQEDTWFDCVDRLKWDTFDTICLKKYLPKKR